MLISKTIFLLILAIAWGVGMFIGVRDGILSDLHFYITMILYGAYTAWSIIATTKRFASKSYALREKDIVYKSGWLWQHVTTVPFNRVQHVSIDQGPIERNFNLSKLKIFTAGGSASDITIPGLRPETADYLKEFIVKKTQDEEE